MAFKRFAVLVGKQSNVSGQSSNPKERQVAN